MKQGQRDSGGMGGTLRRHPHALCQPVRVRGPRSKEIGQHTRYALRP